MRIVRTVFVSVVLLTAAAFAEMSVQQVAARVDQHYNGLRTLQTDFTESYSGAGMSRVESGTLWLKRPGRMRWQYDQPREKLFISDGRTAWFYVPGEKQARKMSLKSLDDLRTPLAYMLGKTKLQKEFAGLSLAPDVKPLGSGNTVLRGVPRNMPNVSDVIFEIGPDFSFQRILVNQSDGSVTEFRFRNQRESVSVPDDRFRFSPPRGVEIVEADTLQQ